MTAIRYLISGIFVFRVAPCKNCMTITRPDTTGCSWCNTANHSSLTDVLTKVQFSEPQHRALNPFVTEHDNGPI